MDDSDEETPRENLPDTSSNASTNSLPNVQNVNTELSQNRMSESESEEDDSDGEWVLPGSRKKKKKRKLLLF